MRARTALRAATLTAAIGVLSLPATAAFAAGGTQPTNTYDNGDQPGPGLSVIQTILIYVCIPLAAFIIIALLASASSFTRGPRYRPGVGWWAAPVWFNGPDDAERAVREAAATAPVRGEGGGASARW